jgi:hypothetical protein
MSRASSRPVSPGNSAGSSTPRITGLATTLLVSVGLGVAGLALVSGTAQAEPVPGTPTVIPEGAAQTIVDVVSEQTGFVPTDVECPSGVEAKVQQAFQCQFTGPEGPYTAYMQITKVDGQYVEYSIVTRRI